jgi:quinol monooxygenase YgiN
MRKLLVMAAAVCALAACCGKNGGNGNGAGVAGNAADQTEQQKEAKMIRLNVFVTVAPEYLDEVVAGLNEMGAASRAEEGCQRYDIFQNTVAPDRLIIVETWESDAALEAHQKTPHYTTILPALSEKMTLTLERFEY